MSGFAPLIDRNRTFASRGAHRGVSFVPAHPVVVVTCFDPRVDPAHVLGIGLGDALVLRNAGGRVRPDTIRDIALLGAMAERSGADASWFEVAIMHHTRCGLQILADPDFRKAFGAQVGCDDKHLEDQAVVDPFESVRADIELLGASPLMPEELTVTGHVYDVDTGLLQSLDT